MHQLTDIVSAVSMTGQHVGLYGERGVGKTSLANVLAEFFDTAQFRSHLQSVRINCSTDDTFATIWQNVFAELGVENGGLHAAGLSPESVRRRLASLDPAALIVLDELDRLEDDAALTTLADTIKTLSDHAVPSTLVLVGVARSIGELIGEHASIVRALVQIEMPRMSAAELGEILTKGCQRASLTVHPSALEEITTLSEGLPHYTHLLGLHAGQRTVQDDRTEIRSDDVRQAIPKAVDRHTILNDYQQATRSARKDALFSEVLLACALAPKNQLGFFTSGSIRPALEVIAGRKLEIPAFSNHLSQFLEPERGAVLQREGSSRRYFYRFSDPIFQPYVILKGLSLGLITNEQRKRFQTVEPDTELTPNDFEANAAQPLF
ncbi:MAG TPA: ATP-binding protein [Solirubrobacteraceae bacterium]|nr:ATP-binding protein [Solirubrobacteraceae bacterium]